MCVCMYVCTATRGFGQQQLFSSWRECGRNMKRFANWHLRSDINQWETKSISSFKTNANVAKDEKDTKLALNIVKLDGWSHLTTHKISRLLYIKFLGWICWRDNIGFCYAIRLPAIAMNHKMRDVDLPFLGMWVEDAFLECSRVKSEPITGREHNIRGLKKKVRAPKVKDWIKGIVLCVCVCVCFWIGKHVG